MWARLLVFSSILLVVPIAQPQECTKLSDTPRYPQSALADGIRIADTAWMDLEGNGEKVLIAFGTSYNGDLVVQRVPTSVSGKPPKILARVSGPMGSSPITGNMLWPADITGDGRDDLLVLTPAGLITLVNEGGQRLEESAPRRTCVNWIQPGDYDADGVDEVMSATRCGFGPRDYDLWEYTADHDWSIRTSLPDRLNTFSHASGDFDQDGADEFVSFSSQPGIWARDVFFGNRANPLTGFSRWNSKQTWERSGASFQDDGIDGFVVQFARHELARFDSDPTFADGVRLTWTGDVSDSLGRVYETTDVDGDGFIDLSYLMDRWTAQLMKGSGPGQGFHVVWSAEIDSLRVVGGADVDGDDVHELLTSRRNEDGILIWDDDAERTYSDGLLREVYTDLAEVPSGGFAADFDHDGLDDIYVQPTHSIDAHVLLSDGTGGFEQPVQPEPALFGTAVHTDDLNRDGTVDLVTSGCGPCGLIPWIGRGDGTFEPGTPAPFRVAASRVIQGDIDGDGQFDYLYQYDSRRSLALVFGRGTSLIKGPEKQINESFPGTFTPYLLVDIDENGRTDVLMSRQTADGTFALEAHPIDSNGRFEEPKPLWSGAFPDRPLSVDAADLDRDGDLDLFVQLPRSLRRPNATLMNDSGERFELVWTGPDRGVEAEERYELRDVNGDRHLDLIERDETFRVRLGDGTGVFSESHGVWGGGVDFNGVFADLDGNGVLDVLKWESSRLRSPWTWLRSVTSGMGQRARRDTSPPSVALKFWPDNTEFNERFTSWEKSTYRVAASVDDDCGTARTTQRRLDLPSLPLDVPVHHQLGSSELVRVFENPTTGARYVLLTGPDESVSRRRFAQTLAAGGWEIPNGHRLTLIQKREFGAPIDFPGIDPQAGLIAHALLDARFPTEWTVTHPQEDISFTLSAIDDVGRTASVTETFDQARQTYCEGDRPIPAVCDGTE